MVVLIMDEYGITAMVKDRNVYYYVKWSPLSKAERYAIITKVPAVAGIFEVYWMDEKKHLRLFFVEKTNYGGLRSEIRRVTDPELCIDNDKTKKILEEKDIYFRYSTTDSAKVMDDVVWFFMQTYFPENTALNHSGRYEKIFLKESAPDNLMWVP
ncbi:MAG: hypothetical protein LBG94_02625 [Treponema sp.]|jgi:hypothetical protein|nr:hypothetical protein [Treponema sp.]